MKKNAALAVCLLAVSLNVAAAPAAPDFTRVEALLREGRGPEAYETLQRFEAELAGDADFDYWLGVAALEAGKPDKASIALERALIVNPEFVGARLDLARAYFALGDYERARLEFRTVLEQDPPPAARATIARHLEELEARAKLRQRLWSGYVEATLGYDSNVNNSTASATVFVPLFGLDLALAPTSRKAGDRYLALGAGLELAVPLDSEVGFYGGLDVRRRANKEEDTFDYDRFDGRLGLQYAKGRNLLRFGLGYGRFFLDLSHNYETASAALEWRHALDERNAVTLSGVHNRIRFPDPTLQGNNAEQTVGGVGFGHAFNAQGTSFVFASAYGGRENDTEGRIDGPRTLLGARLVGQYAWSAQWESYASVSTQWSDYETENFVFATTRRDRLVELALGLVWRPQRAWSLRPQVAYIRNKSNIVIYDYDRYDVSFTLRHDFR